MGTIKIIIYLIAFFMCLSCENRQETRQIEIKDSIAKRQDFITDSIKRENTEQGYVNPTPEYSKGGKKEALKAILSETTVTDAVITDANVLYASVNDDGSRRDGYASYLCEVLSDFNTSVKRVKIVKTNSFNDPNADNAYGVLLGECYCK